MSKSQAGISNDKIALIYEFNKNSPLFVRVAYNELENGNIDQALKILGNGLELYINYPTAFIISALALALKGETQKAAAKLEELKSYIDAEKTIAYYLEKISQIKGNKSDLKLIFNRATEENFVSDEFIPNDVDNNLEELAKKLAKAKINFSDDPVDDSPASKTVELNETRGLVSETLAKIFINQQNYEEALNIYQTLIGIQPEKKNYYLERIAELNKLIGKGN
ncbi:MAG: hypothetical protein KJ799_11990 [Bacteroidetes bacterium]|nr:hypothetical protein [Bacteroidota bacterium]MBU1677490.1 hypothetical protein [Bacteroidota bacterium]MBU2507425.1 hypothetical protein [Bacteroidota bacterium]